MHFNYSAYTPEQWKYINWMGNGGPNGGFDPNGNEYPDTSFMARLVSTGLGVGLSMVTGGMLGPALAGLGSVGSGIVSGAVGGGINGLVQNGDFGSGAASGAIGGLTGGLTKGLGINSAVSNAVGGGELGKILGNAATGAIGGGIKSALTGGDIGNAMLGGGLGGGLSTAFSDATNSMGLGKDIGSAIGSVATGSAMQALGSNFNSGGPSAIKPIARNTTMANSPLSSPYQIGAQSPGQGFNAQGYTAPTLPSPYAGVSNNAQNGMADPNAAPSSSGSSWLDSVLGPAANLYGAYTGYRDAKNPLYTSSSTTTLPSWIQNQYNTALNGVNQNPYQPYNSPMVAGFNNDQNNAFNMVRNNVGAYGTEQGNVVNNANALSGGVSAGDVSNWMNPYQKSVIDATMGQLDHAHQMALEGVNDSAEKAGAFGGDRQAVEKGVADSGYLRDVASTMAGLNSQNYAQALAQANNNFSNKITGNTALQGAINNARANAQTDANNLLTSGNIQQSNAQSALTANYNEFLRQQQAAQTHIQNLLQSMGMLPRNINTNNAYGPQQDPIQGAINGITQSRGAQGAATNPGVQGAANAILSAGGNFLKNVFGGGSAYSNASPLNFANGTYGLPSTGSSSGTSIDSNPFTQSPVTQPWSTQNGFSLPGFDPTFSNYSPPNTPVDTSAYYPGVSAYNPAYDASASSAYYPGVSAYSPAYDANTYSGFDPNSWMGI
jgi:hypothetical protein